MFCCLHSSEDVGVGLLGSTAVCTCRYSSEDGESMFFRKVYIYLEVLQVLLARWSTSMVKIFIFLGFISVPIDYITATYQMYVSVRRMKWQDEWAGMTGESIKKAQRANVSVRYKNCWGKDGTTVKQRGLLAWVGTLPLAKWLDWSGELFWVKVSENYLFRSLNTKQVLCCYATWGSLSSLCIYLLPNCQSRTQEKSTKHTQ
jgi:hypothetical protein